MVYNVLIFNQVSLSVHETDLPDEVGILGIKHVNSLEILSGWWPPELSKILFCCMNCESGDNQSHTLGGLRHSCSVNYHHPKRARFHCFLVLITSLTARWWMWAWKLKCCATMAPSLCKHDNHTLRVPLCSWGEFFARGMVLTALLMTNPAFWDKTPCK